MPSDERNHEGVAIAMSRVEPFLRDPLRFRLRSVLIDQLISAFRRDLLFRDSIQLLAYWGIGPRPSVCKREESALLFLRTWVHELSSLVNFSVETLFVFTDTHAEINEIPGTVQSAYITEASQLLSGKGTQVTTMSSLLKEPPITRTTVCSLEAGWEALHPGLKGEMVRLATPFAGERDPTDVAKAYYNQNVYESAAVSFLFPLSVFVTYQAPAAHPFLPILPTIHAYVDRDKYVKRPWFAGA